VSSKTVWFASIILSSALGSLGGFYASQQALKEPLTKLGLTTPIFILDRAAWVRSLPADAPQEAINRAMEDWRQQAEQLAKAGYLVIDSGMVVAAPEDVYVRPEQ
jgi:hypothetical protein